MWGTYVADDVVPVTDSEAVLQAMLDVVEHMHQGGR